METLPSTADLHLLRNQSNDHEEAKYVDGEELKQFLPEFLNVRYPGRIQEAISGAGADLGWTLQLENSMLYVRASKSTNPFIWIRGGIAYAIPRTDALFSYVAGQNKELVVGRVYALTASDDTFALVVFDEAIFSAYLSMQYEPSMQDFISRFEMSMAYTTQWTTAVADKFGGRPFLPTDWNMLVF